MRVWMYEMIYKEIEGFGTAHLDGLSDEVRELQSEKFDQDLRLSIVGESSCEQFLY